MFKHWQECHSGERRPEFGVKVVRSFTSCLMRQLWESIRIRRRSQEEGVKILNSRGEFSRCSLPRLVIEDSFEKDMKERDTERDENDKLKIEEKEPADAELDTRREQINASNGIKSRRQQTKTKGQKLVDIRQHFKSDSDRGLS